MRLHRWIGTTLLVAITLGSFDECDLLGQQTTRGSERSATEIVPEGSPSRTLSAEGTIAPERAYVDFEGHPHFLLAVDRHKWQAAREMVNVDVSRALTEIPPDLRLGELYTSYCLSRSFRVTAEMEFVRVRSFRRYQEHVLSHYLEMEPWILVEWRIAMKIRYGPLRPDEIPHIVLLLDHPTRYRKWLLGDDIPKLKQQYLTSFYQLKQTGREHEWLSDSYMNRYLEAYLRIHGMNKVSPAPLTR